MRFVGSGLRARQREVESTTMRLGIGRLRVSLGIGIFQLC